MKLSDLDNMKKMAAEMARLVRLERDCQNATMRITIKMVMASSNSDTEHTFSGNSGLSYHEFITDIGAAAEKQRKVLQTQLMMMGVTDFEGIV